MSDQEREYEERFQWTDPRRQVGRLNSGQKRTEESSIPEQRILVAGSRRVQNNYDQISKLAKTIGAKIMRVDNWVLLNGGASEDSPEGNRSVDYLVCTGAREELKEAGDLEVEKDKILTLIPKGTDQTFFHKIGKVETVEGADLSSRRDELVKRADAIITIEGAKGTHDIIKHAMKSKKLIIPIACTGGKSKKTWDDSEKDFLQKFGIKKTSKKYDLLTTARGLENQEELSGLVIDMIKDKIIKDKRFPSMHDTPVHADNPSNEDLLGRKPFAKAIASGIEYYLDKTGPSGSFLVHIYGPWGSGKSTLLKFLEDELGSEWIVVEFNAWHHQRIRPPWWSLMDAVYREILLKTRKTSLRLTLQIRIRENWWRLWNGWSRAFWLATLSAAVIAAAIFFGNIEWVQKVVGGIAATVVAILSGIRAFRDSLLPASPNAADQFAVKTADPMKKLERHLQQMIGWSGNKPLAIFVDDLDRCTDEYTVEFLEGVQTIFRSAPKLVFVIAADRRWLYSSYQKFYGSFSEAFDELGRPLGYLFLDKTFQISVAMPTLSGHYQEDYLNYLVTLGKKPLDNVKKEAKNEGIRQAETLKYSAIEDRLKSTKDGAAENQAFREAAENQAFREAAENQAFREAVVERVFARPEFKERTENFLKDFSRFIEPNPRSMKRLVTAFGIWRARDVLSGSYIDDDKLARWVIISQRWPIVADFLEEYPEVADTIVNFLKEHPEMANAISGKSRKDLDKILKDLKFPADKEAIIRFLERSAESELSEVLPLVQKINERQYQNVSEVADTINGNNREEWDKILMKTGVEEESIRKMLSNSTVINVLLGKNVETAVNSDTVRKLASV